MEQTSMEMPKYRSHKIVHALKITKVVDPTPPESESDGSRLLEVELPFKPVRVDSAYVLKHKPQVGGYYVVYEDGYKSWSPAKAFEEGYTRVT